MLKTWLPRKYHWLASLCLCLFLASCASLSQEISRHFDHGEYWQARALLEKKGAGEYVRKGAKPEALEARNLFALKIEDRYVRDASQLASSGAVRSAIAKVDEGLAISPWSNGLAKMKNELTRRLERVNNIVAKWKGTAPVGEMQLADARALLFDLGQIAPDYADTPLLISLRDSAASSIIEKWEKHIGGQENPITAETSKVFWWDIEAVGSGTLKNDDCVNTMVLLSTDKSTAEKFTLKHNRDILLRGASCLGKTNVKGKGLALLRMQTVSQLWVNRWYQKFISNVADKEDASFDTIDDYESLLKEIPSSARFSVGPAMVHGARGRRILEELPTDRVLPETDGPFAKNGSTPYMPWEAISIAGTVAAIWDETEEAVRKQFERNLAALLGMANK